MAHSTPDTPVVQTVNANTILASVGAIDVAATHTRIYLTRTLPSVEIEFLAVDALKAGDPFTITGLDPGATYSVRAKAWSAGDESAFSGSVSVPMPRQFIYGHVSPSAAGVTDVRVDVGYLPSVGRRFPSAYIGPAVANLAFDSALQTYRRPTDAEAKQYARMVVQITEALSPQIRNLDVVCMVLSKDLGGGAERWTPILYDALVREDAAGFTPSAGAGTERYMPTEYMPVEYFPSEYFA